MKRTLGLAAVSICVFLAPAWGARQDVPTGKEISEKAKAFKLDSTNSFSGQKNGKTVKFTAADLKNLKDMQELESGQVIGLLENDAPGDETGLPPGKYHIYVAKVGNNWRAFAEADGKIVAEAKRAGVEQKKGSTPAKGHFEANGWCNWALIPWWSWPFAPVWIWICF